MNIKKKNRWDNWHVRMPNEKDQLRAMELMRKSGAKSKSEYMRKQLLNEKFLVLSYDKNVEKFIDVVEKILYEINKIGVNYNQITKQINTAHTAKVGEILLSKVELSHQDIKELLTYTNKTIDRLKEYKKNTK